MHIICDIISLLNVISLFFFLALVRFLIVQCLLNFPTNLAFIQEICWTEFPSLGNFHLNICGMKFCFVSISVISIRVCELRFLAGCKRQKWDKSWKRREEGYNSGRIEVGGDLVVVLCHYWSLSLPNTCVSYSVTCNLYTAIRHRFGRILGSEASALSYKGNDYLPTFWTWRFAKFSNCAKNFKTKFPR